MWTPMTDVIFENGSKKGSRVQVSEPEGSRWGKRVGGGKETNRKQFCNTQEIEKEKKKRKKKQLLTAGNKVHCLVFVLINYFSFFKFGKKNLLFASLTSLFLNCILFSKSRLSVTHPGK